MSVLVLNSEKVLEAYKVIRVACYQSNVTAFENFEKLISNDYKRNLHNLNIIQYNSLLYRVFSLLNLEAYNKEYPRDKIEIPEYIEKDFTLDNVNIFYKSLIYNGKYFDYDKSVLIQAYKTLESFTYNINRFNYAKALDIILWKVSEFIIRNCKEYQEAKWIE